ncbi:hypothetical protein llg_32390 [Luteolibacter sp. LG18]|nr:hypothetical protein llg_32390 [Luteolibacter sp. LG18]
MPGHFPPNPPVPESLASAKNAPTPKEHPASLRQHHFQTRSHFVKLKHLHLLGTATIFLAGPLAHAASQTWDGDTDSTWATGANWVGNAAPGSTTTTSNDRATFNTALFGGTRGGAGDPVQITDLAANPRRIGLILFDTANVGPYVIGASGGNTLYLSAQSGSTNSVTMSDTVTTSQTLAGPLKMTQPSGQSDNYGFINNSSTTAANLIISGNIDATNTTRTWQFILDGTNTGNNIISGNINNTTTTGNGGAGPIIKNGTGTWILSGTNIFIGNVSGGNNVHPIVTNGVQVNAGTLVVENNLAFGNTAGAKVFVNGGTLELNSSGPNGSITLENALTVTVASGATVRSAGTNTTNAKITFATGAAVSSTLSTVNAADVFTIGNAANDFSGGASDTVVHIAGPGTVLLSQASNYVGSVSVDNGTLNLGTSTSLGTSGVVNVGSGAKLQTLGNNLALNSLTGAGTLSNGTASTTATVTLTNTSANTFGQLQNGAGTLAFTKAGTGSLTLSGTSNYTGATTLSAGTLNVTGSLGSTAVTAASGSTLSGSGSIAGGVTAGTGVHIAPGDGGDAAIGTLTTGTLSLGSGSQLDIGVTNASTLDKVTVSATDGLTINGGQVNLNGGTGTFTTNGVYNLIAYTGTIGGAGVSSLTLNSLNKSSTKNYTFGTSGGYVTLTVEDSGAAETFWNVNADGNWTTNGNWTPAFAPSGTGALASFGGGGTEITANRTISVDGTITLGALSFNGAANGKSYTLANGGGIIILSNVGTGALVTDTSGNHTIDSLLSLTSSGATFAVINAADTLTVSGIIDGSGTPLIKDGAGTLVLSGTNTYTNGTTINNGTLVINSVASMGDVTGITKINAGTLLTTQDITSSREIQISSSTSAISVDAGKTYSLSGVVKDGSGVGTLNKAGSGTLALTGTNTYTGGTVINAGTVQINTASSLGDAAGAVTINNAVLQATATITGTRNFTLGNANSTFSVDNGMTYTVNGVVSGNTLNKVGTGILTLNGTNTFSSSILKAGTVKLGGANAGIGTGTVTFQGGTLSSQAAGAGDPGGGGYGFANNFVVASGDTGTLNLAYRGGLSGTLTGAGTFNVNTHGVRDDFSGNWSAFTGQINVGTQTGFGDFRINTTSGFGTSKVSLASGVSMYVILNFGSGGATFNMGELSGAAGSYLGGGPVAGRVATYNVGGANTTATFAGVLQNGSGTVAVAKSGTGAWTLSGINTYTGNTSVNAGSLILADNGGLTFRPTTNGTTNAISGTASGTLQLDGDFTIDTSAATIANGNSWTLVNRAALGSVTFGSTFTVVGFTENADVWTKVDGSNTWTFTESTGVLSLTISGYSSWATTNGLTGAAGFENGAGDDPDHDGISNVLEYVLGGNPLSSSGSVLPHLAIDPANFVFTFTRNVDSKTDVTLVFQYGTNLSGWTNVSVGSSSSGPDANGVSVNVAAGTPENITVTVPRAVAGSAPLFGRLKATK